MKPRIFLGSSSESLGTLQLVENNLSVIGDCKLWTNAFSQNKSGLDSLVRETKLSDFSILLAMKDDIIIKREEVYRVARDNVIFEFALFLGSTGLNRAFLLAEDGIDLPSDLEGIAVSKFTLEENKHNTLKKVCDQIIETIAKVSKGSDLGFLPSTALAIGYYYNFIKRVCEDLNNNRRIIIGEKDNSKEVNVKEFAFHVIIPSNLDDNGVDDFKTYYHKKHELNNASTGTLATKRGYPFVFKLEPPDQKDENDKTIHLYDVPSTLNTINEALKLFMPKVQVGESEEVEHLEGRELSNFAKVLRYLISKNTATRNHVFVQEDVGLD